MNDAHSHPCPSCAAKDAELTRLRLGAERLREELATNRGGYAPNVPLKSDPPGDE